MQHTLKSLKEEVRTLADLGVPGVILFGVPAVKDEVGSGAFDPNGIVQVALRELHEELGNRIVLMADLCVDEYTSHGHCGVLNAAGDVDNDATLEIYCKAALAQAQAGAQAILCPSCTDSLQGYHRVRIGAQARALENQIFVAQAPTVGMAPWSPALDENYGAAGLFVPPDGDSPDDGVVAIGTEGQGAWVMADADLARVNRWRTEGAVRPFAHWPEQYCGAIASDLPVEVVPLD